jgi:integrase/recombinase XerD
MVRKTTRRGKRVLVLDFTYTKPDGTQGRFRRDAAVQTLAAAQTEDAARRMGATLRGDPEILCGANGQPLKPVAPKEPTFSETVDRYLAEYARSALALSTLDDYRNRLLKCMVPRFGALTVSKAFDVARSRELDVSMVEGGLSQSSRRNTLLALRSVAKFAVEAKILARAPAFLPLPKRGKRVPSAPPAGDVAAAIDAASGPEHRLVMLLAAHGGLRKGEIRALRCGDCELDRNRLIVRLSRWKWHTSTTKSGHEREVPLTVQLRAALVAAGVDKRPREECAALSKSGKPWGTRGPYSVFESTLRRLKLPHVRLHALRAFFVTTLLNGHVPTHVVRELVGHGDLATTQGYAAIVSGDRGAAVGVLDRAYQGARGEQAQRSGEPVATRARVRPVRRVSSVRIRELRRRVRRRRDSR